MENSLVNGKGNLKMLSICDKIQWAPLNAITLGPRKTERNDTINRHTFCFTDSTKAKQALHTLEKMIPLTIIPISGLQ